MIHVKETASRLILTGRREDLKVLSDAYRVRPPNYFMNPRFVLYKKTKGEKGWDGYLYLMKVKGPTGTLARGFLEDLKTKATQFGIALDLTATLKRPYEGMTLDDVPTDLVVSEHSDYPHQREIVWQWLRHNIGIGEITVSGGKSRSFCMVASMLKRKLKKIRVLYLVPTERLVKQATADAKGFLPDWNVTQYGGSKRDRSGDLVVATYAIVGRNFGELIDWLHSFNVLLVDEAHHASSPTLKKIITEVPAYFKFGATDSAKEDDPVRGMEIQGLLGPVLTRMTAGPLIERGDLAQPTIYVVDNQDWQDRFAHLPHQALPETPAWAYVNGEWKKATYLGPAVQRNELGDPVVVNGSPVPLASTHHLDIGGVELDVESRWCLLERVYDRAIIRFKERNQLAVAWAEHFHREGERTLVVATRTLHVYILQAELEKRIGTEFVRILFSEHSAEERDIAFQWLKDTPGSVLISPLVKEGVSIPELTAGVVADYVGSVDVARQIIGRFIRKKRHREENSAKIVWFTDRQVPSYRRGSMEVLRELETLRGYKFVHPCLGPETRDLGLQYDAN